MIFHSLQFIAFFITVYVIYVSLRHKAQNRFLLVASYVFYATWDWRFLSLIIITTTTDYLCALAIHKSEDKNLRKKFVAISCVINIGILASFKYFNFFVENIISLFSAFGIDLSGPITHVIVPVGISFYTFQSLSYTLDVYRKQVEPTKNILDYALYVSFFPQLVAGPIERAKNLLPQVLADRTITPKKMREGTALIILGIFKKLYIADNLGAIVNPIFAEGANPDGSMVLIAGYAFLFQVYCDFSAYTDIARGTSKLMGFELMENFRAPYFARNVQEFWNRWHISLTTWIRDYLFYPLAFMRIKKRSIPPFWVTIITFTIMGLWHGAAWGFVLWGLYNGIVLAFYTKYSRQLKIYPMLTKPLGDRLQHILSIIITFHFILIGDIFFRSSSLAQSGDMINRLFFDFSITPDFQSQLITLILYITPMLIIDFLTTTKVAEVRVYEVSKALRYAALYVMFFLVINYGESTPTFIYFQF